MPEQFARSIYCIELELFIMNEKLKLECHTSAIFQPTLYCLKILLLSFPLSRPVLRVPLALETS